MSDIKRKINSDLDDRMTLDWQGTRAFFYGLGYNDADIEKPRVGIMNTWNEINPGHIHQRHLADAVREGIIERGGLPFLFGAVGGILTSVWSDWLVRRGMPVLKARKTMMILMAFVAPLCILTPYVSEWQAVSFDAGIGLVVAIFSLIAIMCLSWLYTICVVIAEAFPVKNVASVVGITAGAGAVGGAVFNIFIGSLLVTMGNVLFAVMGVMHLVTAVILWRMVRHETPKTVK